jgi:ferredoxin
VAQGEIELSDKVSFEGFFCLDCRACTTVCPAGVKVGPIMEHVRAQSRNQVHPLPPGWRQFREFLLEEVTRSVDTLSRDAIAQIAYRVGLRGQQIPPILRVLSPPVTDGDRKVVENITRLIEFLLGDFGSAKPTSGSVASRSRQAEQLQALLPVLREYAPSMREFGLLIVTRLTEKQASRAFEWAYSQIER